MLGNQRGEGKFGCLVVLVLMIVGIFVSYNVAPVYLDKVNFEDDLTRIVNRAGAQNWNDQTIQEEIVATGRALNFELSRSDIRVQRTGRFAQAGRVTVVVDYTREVEFPGYVYQFEFTSETSAIRGRL